MEKEGDSENERGITVREGFQERQGVSERGKQERRGEAKARLPPIQMWNNSCLSVCQHLKAQRE